MNRRNNKLLNPTKVSKPKPKPKPAKVSEEDEKPTSSFSWPFQKQAKEKKRKYDEENTEREKLKFFYLIRSRSWDHVLKALASSRGKIICTYKDSSNLNILGMVLGLRPPTGIVELILSHNPELIHEPDCHGVLPMHIGCLNGISIEIFNLLITIGGGRSLSARDKGNRTVLHHAVEYVCLISRCDDSNDSSLISIMYEEGIEVMEQLLSMIPEAVHCISESGDSPLDIPHIFQVKWSCTQNARLDEIYRLLKATSIELYQKSRLAWERNGYDTKTKTPDSVDSTMVSLQDSCRESVSRNGLYEEIDKMSICSDR